MDFVVIGLGLSALALLTGLALLCLVAPHWFRKAGAAHPGDAAYARAQAGERRALGQGFLCAGAVLLLSTGGGISAGLSDKSGAYLIATMATLAILGLLGWDLLYRRQHPIPARRRPVSTRAARAGHEERAEQPARATNGSLTTTTPVRRRVLPARQRVVATAATTADDETQPTAGVATDLQHTDLEEAAAGAEPEAIAGDLATSTPPEPDPEVSIPALDQTLASSSEGDEAEGTDAEANVPDADELPEPRPVEAASANGASEPEPSPDSFAEPEPLPHGDDRVIALFPTAAAQRGRTIVAPTDSNGQR